MADESKLEEARQDARSWRLAARENGRLCIEAEAEVARLRAQLAGRDPVIDLGPIIRDYGVASYARGLADGSRAVLKERHAIEEQRAGLEAVAAMNKQREALTALETALGLA